MGACIDRAASNKKYRYQSGVQGIKELGKLRRDSKSPNKKPEVEQNLSAKLQPAQGVQSMKKQLMASGRWEVSSPEVPILHVSPGRSNEKGKSNNQLYRRVDHGISPKESEPADEGHVSFPYTGRASLKTTRQSLNIGIDHYLTEQILELSRQTKGQKYMYRQPNLQRFPIVRVQLP